MSQPLDPKALARGIVQQLQEEPARYKLFSVWWWAVKAVLKRMGYGSVQLPMLGSYVDPEQAAMVPHGSLAETLAAAMEEYAQNACYPHSDGRVETPDGDMVLIVDEDAGL